MLAPTLPEYASCPRAKNAPLEFSATQLRFAQLENIGCVLRT